MSIKNVFDGILVFIAIVMFCAMIWFSGILMRYGAFCESQMPSMQEMN